MLKQILIILFIVLMFTGCKSYIVAEELNDRISELEVEINMLEEISEHINESDKLIQELQLSIVGLQDRITELNIEDEMQGIYLDLEDINHDMDELERNEEFIQRIFFGNAIFDAKTIQKGDYIASMEFVGREEKTRYKFVGRKTLVGHYSISLNDEYWGSDIVTFGFDDEVTDVLPRANEDYRTLWFMFSNYDEAFEMLSTNGMNGKATIVIDEYVIDLMQSDVVNTARIVEVIYD